MNRAVTLLCGMHVLLIASGCAALPRSNSGLAFNVVGFGAKADGETLDTVAFQHAIEAARQAGGATVIVPRGQYKIAPIDLCSGLRLQLAAGAVVTLTDDPEAFPLTDTRHDGLMQPARRAGLLADGCTDVSITGPGTLAGAGPRWWAQVKARSTADASDPTTHRPPMVQFRNCRKVRIEGVTFADAPRSAVHVLFSDDVIVRASSFEAPHGSDTTGIEIDSSRRVRVEDSRFAVGARAIALEAGRRDPSPRPARATEDVVIRGCGFTQSAAGVAIGPNVAGGVLRVRVLESSFEGGDVGVQIQSSPDRTGAIQGIRLADLRMTGVSSPFVISLQGKSIAPAPGDDPATAPDIRDITVARLTVTDALRAGIIEGLEQSPIRNLRFETLNLSANYGISCSRAADVTFNTVKIATDFGPAILRTDTSNLQIDNWIEATRQAEPATAPTTNASASSAR